MLSNAISPRLARWHKTTLSQRTFTQLNISNSLVWLIVRSACFTFLLIGSCAFLVVSLGRTSPDSYVIAYENFENLHLLDVNTGLSMHLAYDAFLPSWSPDGCQVIFTQDRRGP